MSATALPLRQAMDANSTATAFTAKIPVATKPSGTGVFDVFAAALGIATAHCLPKFLQVIPFGTDADGETFDLRVWGWSRVLGGNLWVPQLLTQLAVTLGNVSGAAIGTNHFLSDTLVATDGAVADSGTGTSILSPENDTPASALIHLRGCELIEFDFDLGTAAAANAYWRAMDQS